MNDLAKVAANPNEVDNLDTENIPELLGAVEALRARLWARLQAPPYPATATGPEPLLEADDVAERLSMPKARIYELAREDRIPHIRIGRQVRFPERRLAAWIEEGGTAA